MPRLRAAVVAGLLGWFAVGAFVVIAPAWQGGDPGAPPRQPTPPEESPYSTTWDHVRMDEVELTKYGNGTFEAGMNRLGDRGFELFVVMSMDEGRAGFHYFKRSPWTAPVPRPRYEYRRLDSGDIQELGEGSFAAGLNKVGQDNWELIALTASTEGKAGYHYFKRTKQ